MERLKLFGALLNVYKVAHSHFALRGSRISPEGQSNEIELEKIMASSPSSCSPVALATTPRLFKIIYLLAISVKEYNQNNSKTKQKKKFQSQK